MAVIYLGRQLPAASSSPPGDQRDGPSLTRIPTVRDRAFLLLGLAPDGGCLAALVTQSAGELLPHLFTLARRDVQGHLPLAVCFCGPIRELPRLGVIQHRALWSPDFPRPATSAGRDRPARSRVFVILTRRGWNVKDK